MTNHSLYLAKVIFKNLLEDNKYMSYTYCFEAAHYKEAYQQALIIASEKYFTLNESGSYNFIGLQELEALSEQQMPAAYSNLINAVANIDEDALKTYQDDLIQHLSVA